MALPESNMSMIEEGIRMILKGLGESPDRDGIRETPKRVARMYSDILDGNFIEKDEFTSFGGEEYEGAVMVHHVPFYAFCEHHMSMFYGHFGMAYIPGDRILGLSKLIRIFRVGCKKITIQERITEEAVELLEESANPMGSMCYVQAEHTCMSLRGVKSPGSLTTTWAYRGEYEKNLELRQQFINEASK